MLLLAGALALAGCKKIEPTTPAVCHEADLLVDLGSREPSLLEANRTFEHGDFAAAELETLAWLSNLQETSTSTTFSALQRAYTLLATIYAKRGETARAAACTFVATHFKGMSWQGRNRMDALGMPTPQDGKPQEPKAPDTRPQP